MIALSKRERNKIQRMNKKTTLRMRKIGKHQGLEAKIEEMLQLRKLYIKNTHHIVASQSLERSIFLTLDQKILTEFCTSKKN